MFDLDFKIQLRTDAEPGTGLGDELIDNRVPRDQDGEPTIPGSHLKGLMRDQMAEIERLQGWDGLTERVFGAPGGPEATGPQSQSPFSITGAVADRSVETHRVSRTAIDPDTGRAKETSLRTTESIPADTTFSGRLVVDAEAGSPEDLALRLCLLSLRAVGGSRTRGCGQCVVSIEGETRSPGGLLRELGSSLKEGLPEPTQPRSSGDPPPLGTEASFLRLVFRAEAPVCCPETPVRTNVIRSGFPIPASAVQGAILTKLNRSHPDLASACFKNSVFRAWPLLPCGPADAEGPKLPIPVRVPLTHRVAKLASSDNSSPDDFSDFALEEAGSAGSSSHGPPKARDGVLLRQDQGGVQLWPASGMPRLHIAHGVHNDPTTEDGRNLYTIEAMAPLTWCGVLCLPSAAADALLEAVNESPRVAFGKGRSTHGLGTLRIEQITDHPLAGGSGEAARVLIAQSPILLPDQMESGAAVRDEMRTVVRGWADEHGLPEVSDVWGVAGIRFGWNRHGRGKANTRGRLRACRVIQPGGVVKFASAPSPDSLSGALIAGCGGGRERGYGALSRHPGKAVALYDLPREVPELSPDPAEGATRAVLDIYRRNRGPLPSVSQISAVEQRLLKTGRQGALGYLDHQCERTPRIWHTWDSIIEDVEKLLRNEDEKQAATGLRFLVDLIRSETGDRT